MTDIIFISYRRERDHGTAGWLNHLLQTEFGRDKVFFDIDGFLAGDNFVQKLPEFVAQCDIFLAVVGRNWTDAQDAAGQLRLANPKDWVRIEIESALRMDKRVIPVLVDGVSMPLPDALPPSLAPMTERQARSLRHERFVADVQGLIKDIATVRARAEDQRQDEARRRLAEAEAHETAARREEEARRQEEERRADEERVQWAAREAEENRETERQRIAGAQARAREEAARRETEARQREEARKAAEALAREREEAARREARERQEDEERRAEEDLAREAAREAEERRDAEQDRMAAVETRAQAGRHEAEERHRLEKAAELRRREVKDRQWDEERRAADDLAREAVREAAQRRQSEQDRMAAAEARAEAARHEAEERHLGEKADELRRREAGYSHRVRHHAAAAEELSRQAIELKTGQQNGTAGLLGSVQVDTTETKPRIDDDSDRFGPQVSVRSVSFKKETNERKFSDRLLLNKFMSGNTRRSTQLLIFSSLLLILPPILAIILINKNILGYETYLIEDNINIAETGKVRAEDADSRSSQNSGSVLDRYKILAENGDANAMYSLAEMYYYGRGVDQDVLSARKLYEKSANFGNADAMFSVGWLYEFGKSVPKNINTAKYWYQKAANLGNADAQKRLSDLNRLR